MLVMLLPEQLTDYWMAFEGHVERSMPPLASEYADANQVLFSLMMGSSQCWVLMDQKQEVKGFIITTTLLDISGVRTLIIYCAVIFDKTMSVDWKAELETMKKYAASRECVKLASFVANEKIIKALEAFGADTRFTFVTLGL